MPRYYAAVVTTSTTQTSGGGVSNFFTASDTVAQCRLPVITNARFVESQAYFCYVGYWPIGSVWQHAAVWQVNTAGAAIPAEVGIFTSPKAPEGSPQVLTRIAVTATIEDLSVNATRAKRNVVAFGLTLFTASHLWGGWRTAIPGGLAEPDLVGHSFDGQECMLLTLNSAPALTGTTSWLVTNVGNAAGAQAPWIRLEQF